MTEDQIRTTARLLEARDAMRATHGDGWKAKIEELAPFIRRQAKEDGTSLMAGAIHLAKQAAADERPNLSVMLLAVGCELTPENDSAAAMPADENPYDSDDYQRYLAECAKHCRCDYDICESVLAGAPCEERQRYIPDED